MNAFRHESDSADLFNVAAFLAGVEEGGGISRAAMSRRLGLSRQTASTIATKLIESGLVAEREGKADGRGRPGLILELGAEKWFALGAEFHSGRWVFALTNLRGDIVSSSSRSLPEQSPEAFLEILAEGLSEAMKTCPGRLLPAIGIGAPGLVDCERGLIVRADDLGWSSIAIADYLKIRLGLDAYVINRNRGSGLAEARFGAGRGQGSFVYVGIGTGISAAFVVEGRLLHGANYSAGEIGHLVVEPEGPTCRCGRRGCLQVLASGSAMAARAATFIAEGRTTSLALLPPGRLRGEDICAAARLGDLVALDCLEVAASRLGLALANIVTTFNPDKILLGGPVGREEGPFLDLVRASTERWAMDYPFSAAKIERGALGERAGALGAACLVLDRKLHLVLEAS